MGGVPGLSPELAWPFEFEEAEQGEEAEEAEGAEEAQGHHGGC
jgi:hypothetical protein